MLQIRNGIFETNSSSTHSLSIRRNYCLELNRMPIADDGYIHVELGEFGWEIETYTEQYDKLSYLLTMIQYFNGINTYYAGSNTLEEEIEKLMATKDFQQISKEVAEYANCKGIIIDTSSGYIDHQSVEYYNLEDFIPTNIIDFIFGSVVIHTDNDNHC